MLLIIDSREQHPLEFPALRDVTVQVEALPVGDYSAQHDGEPETSIVERKSVADLFGSFTANYDAERLKILKAKDLGLTYILAIEAPLFDVLQGYSYWKDGQLHEHRKSGLAMVRQLMTCQRKYGIQTWFCSHRREMAFRIQEYFLARERMTVQPPTGRTGR